MPGGSVVDCAEELVERIRGLFEDDPEGELTGLRAPVEHSGNEPEMRLVRVVDGYPDFTKRDEHHAPMVLARLTDQDNGSHAEQPTDQVTIRVVSIVHMVEPADYKFGWIILGRIRADLKKKPFLGGGLYQVLADRLPISEDADLSAWPEQVLNMNVTVIVPETLQTHGPDGRLLSEDV